MILYALGNEHKYGKWRHSEQVFFNHNAMSLKFALLSFEFGFTAANNVSRGMTRKGIKELLNKETDLLFCNQIYI